MKSIPMSFKVNIDSVTLDVIAARLKGVVSPYHILQWLANFQENEVNLAIGLVKNLTVFTAGEVEEIYHKGLIELLKTVPRDQKVAVLPIGAFGKSGSMMIYLFRKTNAYKYNSKRITLCPTSAELSTLDDSHTSLVLLDDFIGTGKTVTDYYEPEIKPHAGRFQQVCFLGVAAMDSALP